MANREILIVCKEAATETNVKTAEKRIYDNNEAATRSHLSDNKNSTSTNSSSSSKSATKYLGCGSVWPKNNNNNKQKQKQLNTAAAINDNLHLRSLLLLITMTVSMTILQMPTAIRAAAIPAAGQVKDTHGMPHEAQARDVVNIAAIGDIDSESGSSSIDDDIFDMAMSNQHHNYGYSSSKNARSRLRKRHSDGSYLQHHLDEGRMDWINPCGGFYEETSESDSHPRPSSYFLKKLRNEVNIEFHIINNTMHLIDISRMGMWSKHKIYSYMPKINLTSDIALKSWYKHMQIYVATFAYLGRKQYKWEHHRYTAPPKLSTELNELLLSARRILCAIETTINGSFPFPENQKRLITISAEDMNRTLNFYTKDEVNRYPDMIVEPIELDLQYAKYKYYLYLRRMWRVLRLKSKQKARKALRLQSVEATLPADRINLALDEINRDSSSSSIGSESFELLSKEINRSSRPHNRRNKRKHRKAATAPKSAELPKLI